VKSVLESTAFEFLDGELTSMSISAVKRDDRQMERLLHIDMKCAVKYCFIEMEIKTIGLELKRSKRNLVDEAHLERKLFHHFRDLRSQKEAAA